MPDALGEEFLIVQKEFDGFADTRERLDLLALDKEGRLVVVENKLDDSGRDVVWQALKYVAYCSSLKKAEIVEIYQKYLDRWFEDADAATNLCEFLGVEELDDVVLNAGNEQRLVLIAANFRKEVTATVLWLLRHGVRAQCFRVVPALLREGPGAAHPARGLPAHRHPPGARPRGELRGRAGHRHRGRA